MFFCVVILGYSVGVADGDPTGTEIVVVFLLLLMIICSARLKSRSVEKQMTYLSRSKFFGGI